MLTIRTSPVYLSVSFLALLQVIESTMFSCDVFWLPVFVCHLFGREAKALVRYFPYENGNTTDLLFSLMVGDEVDSHRVLPHNVVGTLQPTIGYVSNL